MPITQLDDRIPVATRDEAGRKRCHRCKIFTDVGQFAPSAKARDSLSVHCLNCARDRVLGSRYGVTAARYDELLRAQGGGCAICHGVNASGRALAVDHNHACCPGDRSCGACVRGLLCSNCNFGIGLLGESAERLASATEYLRQWQ